MYNQEGKLFEYERQWKYESKDKENINLPVSTLALKIRFKSKEKITISFKNGLLNSFKVLSIFIIFKANIDQIDLYQKMLKQKPDI